MTAYAIAHLRPGDPHDDIVTYMETIQATMEPFGGRFAVHGATHRTLEGNWPGAVVVVAFPDMGRAAAWYESDAYQEILPLRTRHMDGDVILVEGVPDGYDAQVTASATRSRMLARRV
ncbi:DUF1330 domain-containing protein [Streptomyces tsukubensis]|uniref:DUF1330 domain-containing protein n=1 Tax=Streptomyces tsukubensis TaxID=83656 RepID=A0A1V4ADF9_9ACTN|nr:DUF1330 domain-containing protein [Streptomyces tsukubensis]OON81447.1 hypothetical protein B1H18_09055 [Streptomyces tsukubensis]QFR95424.1 DUF1330 domain-containing protein [Streptomyces tsukubensis]